MLKTLAAQIKQYKRSTLLTPLFTVLEVVMEVLIPFVTAAIIDKGINAGDISKVYIYGGIMLVMAFMSLTFGVLAGKFAANASAGFACNLRDAMFTNIQQFSFSNIDKFSTARSRYTYDHRRHQSPERVPDDNTHCCKSSYHARKQHCNVYVH